VATSGVGGRGGVHVRLGFAAGGVKAVAGTLKPLLAFGPCRRLPSLRVGLPRLGYFAAAGFKAPGSFPPLPGSCRLRRRRLSVGLYGQVIPPPCFQVPWLPAAAVVVGIRGSRPAGGVLRFRLWSGRLPQRLAGFKAAGPLEPLRGFGLRRRWPSTGLRVRLRRRGHLSELLVDRPSPLAGLGELGGLGEGLADAFASVVDLAVGVAGVGEDDGFAVLQVVEAVLEPGHQGAGICFPEFAGRHADAHARCAVERDAH